MQKIRTVVYLEKRESKALKTMSTKTGASVGELIRRAVVMFLRQGR